ncbi:MAG: class I SAM-dependent methyltransferase [Candidatus Heimdallarchaeota archaeon]|nr:class I SAM-dependent methyltransferase [Candidatus Heimdallarchaeota archaeon]
MSMDPTGRFSDRVENYIRYRPTYPKDLIAELKKAQLLSEDSVIADIGSGTGIFTKLLLKAGSTVYAVEPNEEMRVAAEKILGWYPNFISVNGQAEATTLGRRSVDLIAAAQAFHWFNTEETKWEFKRILKPTGSLVLVYNSRQIERTPFMKGYDELLKKYCPEYEGIAQQYINLRQAKDFFGTDDVNHFVCNNYQIFNFEGLKGRLLSSSYTPKEDQVGFDLLLEGLEALYKKHQENDQVQFTYDTEMFYGKPVFPDEA